MNSRCFHRGVSWIWLLTILWVPLWQGCAHQVALPEELAHTVYTIDQTTGPLVRPWTPEFLAYGYADAFNRIGRPVAVKGRAGSTNVRIDTAQPTVYFMQRTFTTAKAAYTNWIYRIHFPKVPYSLIPFNLTAGDHAGLMVVITLDDRYRPLLVTTVHTCGCYKAFTPTDLLEVDDLPEGWDLNHRHPVYGEQLPPQLPIKGIDNPRLLLHLRPGVHRVMDLEVVPADHLKGARYVKIPMKIEPMAALEQLPAGDTTTSFFYEEGWRKGYVKGSIKPFEMIFMSLISFDLFVGSDKTYADPAISDNPFYTSLKPWRRQDSDMWDFARFLAYWGWRL